MGVASGCGEQEVGVASGCGEQEVGVASGSGWNLWVWLLGVVLRRYIDFLILLILLFCSFFNIYIMVHMHVIIINITLTSLARNFTPHEYYMILPC